MCVHGVTVIMMSKQPLLYFSHITVYSLVLCLLVLKLRSAWCRSTDYFTERALTFKIKIQKHGPVIPKA